MSTPSYQELRKKLHKMLDHCSIGVYDVDGDPLWILIINDPEQRKQQDMYNVLVRLNSFTREENLIFDNESFDTLLKMVESNDYENLMVATAIVAEEEKKLPDA